MVNNKIHLSNLKVTIFFNSVRVNVGKNNQTEFARLNKRSVRLKTANIHQYD